MYPIASALFEEWRTQLLNDRYMIREMYASEEYQDVLRFYAEKPRTPENDASVIAMMKRFERQFADDCLDKINAMRAFLGYAPVRDMRYLMRGPAVDDTQPIPLITPELLAQLDRQCA